MEPAARPQRSARVDRRGPREPLDRRQRPAQVGRRLFPQAHSRQVHDARAHAQRLRNQRPVPRHRRDLAPHRQRRPRYHHPPADRTARLRLRFRSEIWEKLRGVDLHSLQTGMDNVQHQRLRARRIDARRALRRLARPARTRSNHRRPQRQSRVRQPAAQVQHRRHRLHRELHPRGVTGPRARTRNAARHSWLQYPRRRQDGLGRLHRRFSPQCLRGASRGGRGRR